MLPWTGLAGVSGGSGMAGNTGGSWTQVKSGNVANVGSAIGTNAKSITVQNSTLPFL